jgi:hypothetical protein
MCNHTFNPNYLPKISYPYSYLKYPFQHYFRLIEDFLSFMYEGIDFRVIPHRDGYDIFILNVNPYKEYSPFNFDPSYRVKVGESFTHINSFELFQTFYAYIPDIVPYLNFKLVANPPSYFNMGDIKTDHNGVFEEFNLKEYYFREEGSRQYYSNERMTEYEPKRRVVRYDEFTW